MTIIDKINQIITRPSDLIGKPPLAIGMLINIILFLGGYWIVLEIMDLLIDRAENRIKKSEQNQNTDGK